VATLQRQWVPPELHVTKTYSNTLGGTLNMMFYTTAAG
jgi:hypothetical protein